MLHEEKIITTVNINRNSKQHTHPVDYEKLPSVSTKCFPVTVTGSPVNYENSETILFKSKNKFSLDCPAKHCTKIKKRNNIDVAKYV